MSFFAELKRRNVYRVAAIYVIVGWLILQVTDVLSSLLTLPEWTGRLVFALLLLGLPVALVLAWAFELTPEGIRLEREISSNDMPRKPGRDRLDYVIVAALVVALSYFAWQHEWQTSRNPGNDALRSVVVLPFENLMNDSDQDYFVAGMHEALITELSRSGSLRVISRTTAMRFRNADKTVPQIADELGVQMVVEGSVLRARDTVRITVQLIDAETDEHLWADNFDRRLSDILALYAEVTREITHRIRVTLSDGTRIPAEAHRTVDPDVYELYLKGRYLCDNWSPQEMARGISLLQEAVSQDPANAAAQAHLALCLQYAAFFGYEKPTDIHTRSRAAATTAIQLDNDLAEGHVGLAGILYYLEYNPRAALRELEVALDKNPSSVRALLHLSWLLGEAGQLQAAVDYNRRALALDPLSTVVNHALGQAYFLGRDYANAETAFAKALELDRSDPSLVYSLAWTYEQTGRLEEAIELHRKAVSLSDEAPLYLGALGYSLCLAGRYDEAKEILARLKTDEAATAYDMAVVHVGLGDRDAAIRSLEQAYRDRDSQLIYINRAPKFDSLRTDPRFERLIERIGWPAPDEPLGQ